MPSIDDFPVSGLFSKKYEQFFQLAEDGKLGLGIQVLKECWELLPDPKFEIYDSFNVAQDLVTTYLELGMIKEAEEWVNIMQKCDPGRQHGERELFAGVIAYEKGNFSEAFDFFKIASKKTYRNRVFDYVNSKYYNFFKTKKSEK